MYNLPTIHQRLNNKNTFEILIRKEFIDVLKKKKIKNANGLSVSCGDGVWDYIALKNKNNFKRLIATDVIKRCPVKKKDVKLLKSFTDWKYKYCARDQKLHFKKNYFDMIWHFDVIEHVDKPYLFLNEQYRILKKGGLLVFGTPNLFRPGNIFKILLGKLKFPEKIGYNKIIGNYIHTIEFHEEHLRQILKEIGYKNIKIQTLYLGSFAHSIKIKSKPKSNIGKLLGHFLFCEATK